MENTTYSRQPCVKLLTGRPLITADASVIIGSRAEVETVAVSQVPRWKRGGTCAPRASRKDHSSADALTQPSATRAALPPPELEDGELVFSATKSAAKRHSGHRKHAHLGTSNMENHQNSLRDSLVFGL